MIQSRDIPLPIQREVRQRCGFGCVICGLPLYEYDHMKEWATYKEHVAEDITLLCDFHHKQVTNGLLSRKQVLEFNSDPHNLKKENSNSMPLYFSGKTCTVIVGNNSFQRAIDEETVFLFPIMIDNIPIIGFIIQDEHLLLNINQFDEFNNPLFQIINNNLSYSVSPWDIEMIGKKLIIRDKPRSFRLVINFCPPDRVEILQGLFYCNGICIDISEKQTFVRAKDTEQKISRTNVKGCPGGIILGSSSLNGFFKTENIRRF